MKIISVRENPEYKDVAIQYFQGSWPEVAPIIYQDCIANCIDAAQSLPQWYLLEKDSEIIGCTGLITNDFISRMDLYPWLCALFINEEHRGNNYGNILIEHIKSDTKRFGFAHLYLSTEHIGYYEKLGFEYIAQGYHPWGDESRIYQVLV
ncbi:GNAT family N-acetyltransferase [Sphingobacterium yanglingense]|uniref:Acetyltransferase (GNAT) family protein n=1 Tax=Sphingobacterium yanglingense TaxID=1437280 RepID=A0A4R6WHA7_9SPHI|nr:GNAT family N-acetyltransferase [Sphingobacterium yanglingense]TDQ77886.1 acetyltransferase (GNAT) family protein [Sphingobacterium yanglingense]